MNTHTRLKDFGRCFLTALLTTMAFPRLEVWGLAWIALVPFMIVLDGKTPWQGFRTGFVCGFLTFFGALYWLFHITEWFSVVAGAGVIILFFYLAVYYALFGFFYCSSHAMSPVRRLFFLPSVWAVLEFVRAHLFTGFDWISLGHSQFRNLCSIQMADFSGVFGVSFIIVMTNYFLKEIRRRRQPFMFRCVFYAVFISHLLYGVVRLREPLPPETLRVGIVQGNVDQDMKWQEFAWPMIMKAHKTLTRQTALKQPELIIWPETSFPGILGEDDQLFSEIEDLAREVKRPILLGAIERKDKDYFNTVMLTDADGNIVRKYSKIHLVPFGEFFPGRNLIGPLAKWVPIDDFTRGSDYAIFNASGAKAFSVLICFEDTIAGMARPFVRRGAKLLVNMTNDAWFRDSKASTLHLSSSIFRTVENRRSLVRSANTGLSNAIDPYGRIITQIADQHGKSVNIQGYAVVDVPLNGRTTFYTKFGNAFVFLCLGYIISLFLLKRRK
ncbi:MAG: apolipoprotein N-acyltransferase [Candidatus Omnitrophota bacterium]